jgi:hypothetical protein
VFEGSEVTDAGQEKTGADRFWEWVGKNSLRWGPVAVVAIAALFTALNREANIYDIASSIFQVSGTIVALILPAAELANNFIRVFADDMVIRIVEAESVTPQERIAITTSIANELKQHLVPAWRGSLCALYAFLISCVLMFAPLGSLTIRSRAIPIDSLLLGLDLGFIIVGAFLFFPTAWYTYSLRSLENAKQVVASFVKPPDMSPGATGTAPAGPTQPAEAMAPEANSPK